MVTGSAGEGNLGTHGFQVPPEMLKKYAAPLPRYTSYPTAPSWKDLTPAEVEALLAPALARNAPLSVYVHLPFCKSLCYYCGCNMMVTRQEELVSSYVDTVITELETLARRVTHRQVVQIHWGGGTPTHLKPAEIERLGKAIHRAFKVSPSAEISVEVHPPVTTSEQVKVLAGLGFTRVSMGVQDFDEKVQEAVHRIQPPEQTLRLAEQCRAAGFTSVNVDLMYGLPHQDVDSFMRTVDALDSMKPDRVALFGYAHVPWLKPHQNLMPADALPGPQQRVAIFEAAMQAFLRRGYRYIGLDHFALPGDELSKAQEARALRRNFMGYTTQPQTDMLAFGASGIAELDTAFLQNEREVKPYMELVSSGKPPALRGMALTADDRLRRDVIADLFCNLAADLEVLGARHGVDGRTCFQRELEALTPMRQDGLVEVDGTRLRITQRGQLLLRNVASVFDAYLPKPGAATGPRHASAV